MKQKISDFQLALLVANVIFAGPVISLPQIILQQGDQNAWLVPIIIYPILISFIFIIFGKNKQPEWLQNVLIIGDKSKWIEKAFILLFLLGYFHHRQRFKRNDRLCCDSSITNDSERYFNGIVHVSHCLYRHFRD
jgi:hypothetical protein